MNLNESFITIGLGRYARFLSAGILLTFASANCARAQTIDLATDDAVIAELQKRVDAKRAQLGTTGDSKLDAKIRGSSRLDARSVCVKRLKKATKVIVIGFFATDAGCHFDGAFINSRYFEKTDPALSKNALDALGWAKASKKTREMLAGYWVEKGLLAFFTTHYTKPKELGNFDVHPPQVMTTEKGEIKVTIWVQLPSGMSREKGFQHFEYRFKKDGELSGGTTLDAVIT
jgi:hypothetical protein